MRVLFLNQYYPPDASATAYLLGELTEDLAARHNLEPWVVAGKPSYNADTSTYRPAGAHAIRTRSTAFSRAHMAGRFCNYATYVAMALYESVLVPRPDVVVALTDPPIVGLLGLLAARRYRVPFVYVCEDVFPDVGVALRRLDNPLIVWLWRRLNRILRRGAARVVAVGRDMADKLEQEGVAPTKIALLPNWAEDVSLAPETVPSLRREFGWGDRFVVMHAGNVGLAQNLEIMVDTADRLRDREDMLFVVVGDGAAREGLQLRSARLGLRNIAFLPQRPREEAQALVAAADVHFVSLARGLWGCVAPSKIYGILAHGRPFIAAVDRDSEIDRIIQESGAGIRVDPGDADAAAQALLAFVGGRVDPEAAGAAGRRLFEERYRRSTATQGYAELLASLAEMPPSRKPAARRALWRASPARRSTL